VVGLYLRCRGPNGGYACLPDAGGFNDQCAWLMDAFDVVAGALEALRPKRDGEW
jgi:hypothetical protein